MNGTPREMTAAERVEHGIRTRFRRKLWTPFTVALKRYSLIGAGARVAVQVTGRAEAVLLAKLIQELERYSEVPFQAVFLFLDTEALRQLAEQLAVPAVWLPRETDTAGFCRAAAASGCSRLADAAVTEDAVETALAAMLSEGVLRTVPPVSRQDGITLIRPMYCVHRESVQAWARTCGIVFPPEEPDAAIQRARTLLEELRQANPNVVSSVFRSLHQVNLDTIPGWRDGEAEHGFFR